MKRRGRHHHRSIFSVFKNTISTQNTASRCFHLLFKKSFFIYLYSAFDAAVVVVVESQHPPLLVDFPTSMLCSRRPSPSCLCAPFSGVSFFSTAASDTGVGRVRRENLVHTQRKDETPPQNGRNCAIFSHCYFPEQFSKRGPFFAHLFL